MSKSPAEFVQVDLRIQSAVDAILAERSQHLRKIEDLEAQIGVRKKQISAHIVEKKALKMEISKQRTTIATAQEEIAKLRRLLESREQQKPVGATPAPSVKNNEQNTPVKAGNVSPPQVDNLQPPAMMLNLANIKVLDESIPLRSEHDEYEQLERALQMQNETEPKKMKPIALDGGRRAFKCPWEFCGATVDRRFREKHLGIHQHGTHKCPHCGLPHKQRQQMLQHVRSVHGSKAAAAICRPRGRRAGKTSSTQ